MEENPNPIPDLPTDILIQVLCRLPVKTLIRLSCVCKFWKDLIRSDRIFIGCHLKESLETQRSNSNVLMYSDCDSDTVDRDNPKLSVQRFINADENSLRKSFFLGSYIYLVGCVNGVFCFYEYWSDNVYLWNPALHQFRMLPRCCDKFINIVAFFFEPTNDDYTVVKIHKFSSKVHIYKLSSNSWKKTRIPYRPSGVMVYIKDKVALFHMGALHWLSYIGDEKLFLNVYDLGRKRFQENLLSNGIIPYKSYFATLGLIKGCISVFGRSTTNGKYEVWMMKEYGVENSWTKLFEIPIRCIILQGYMPGTSTSGKVVVKQKFGVNQEDYVVLYDPETKETEFAQDESILLFEKYKKYFLTDNYIESLVSVFPPVRRTSGRFIAK